TSARHSLRPAVRRRPGHGLTTCHADRKTATPIPLSVYFPRFWPRKTPLSPLGMVLALPVSQLSGPILSEDFNDPDCLTRGEKLMVPANPNDRIPSDGSDPVPPVNRLAERLRHAFDQHPAVFREEFSREAV